MPDNINVEITETPQNVNVNITDTPQNVSIDINTTQTIWGAILGTLSNQTDLWSQLSAKALNIDLQTLKTFVEINSAQWVETTDIIPTVVNFLSSTPVTLNTVNVIGQSLSGGIPLHDIFLTTENDSQTLSYLPSSYSLTISNGNTVNLSSINSLFGRVSGKYEDVYTSVVSNSGNWNTAYNIGTTYQNTSSTFATNTTLNNLSSILTPVTLTNTLTGLLATNLAFLNYQTSVGASTAILLPTSVYQNASGNWQHTYTIVQNNSASWEESADISAITTTVASNSANWNTAYNIGTTYQNTSSSFATNTILNTVSSVLTPHTLTNSLTSQLALNTDLNSYKTSVAAATATLLPTSVYKDASGFWQNAYNTATTYQSNSSSYATNNYVNSNFFPISGGIISGPTRINNNLTVFGNLTATGTTTFANTIFSVTSSLSVVHTGSGPALYVGNNGDGDIASFYDIDQNIEILHVGGQNGTFPNVGVKTSEPNKDFTVKGELSASGTIYEGTGNSKQWNEAYTNLTTNSAAYLSSVDLTFLSVSGNWNTAYQNVSSQSLNTTNNVEFNLVRVPSLGGRFEVGSGSIIISNDIGESYIESDTGYGINLETGGLGMYNSFPWNIRAQGIYNSGSNLTINFPVSNVEVLYPLDVSGVITATDGNSTNWNTAYQNVSSQSLNTTDNVEFNQVNANVYLSGGTNLLNILSSSGGGGDPGVNTVVYENSATWIDTSTVVQTNSASWAVDSTTDTGVRALTGNWQSTYTTVQSNSASWVNSKTIAQFTAIDNQPLSANFATLDTRISIAVLDFDDTTTESACFVGVIPEGINLSSGLRVRLHWTASTATTGNVEWGVQFMNLNTPLSADSFDAAAFGITTTSNTPGLPSTTTITCTTLNGMTAGSFYRMRVFRDSADTVNDTMAGDAELIAVEVRSVI